MRTASITLPPEPTSSRACRRFLLSTLDEWGADQFTDEAMLLLSELVTNAVLHAGTDIDVTIRLDGDLLRVEVADGNPRLPSVRHYSVLSGTGRGLALVAETAKSWDAEPTPAGGKTVWFELEAAHG
jgi:anti-sigma regulatory factor (Ser/Thr protein kinase)